MDSAVSIIGARLASRTVDLMRLPIFAAAKQYTAPQSLLLITTNYELYTAVYPICLANVIAQIDSEQIRLPLVKNLWEEHGRGNPSRGHRLMMATFVSSVRRAYELSEIDPETTISPTTRAAIEELKTVTREQGPHRGVGALLALELTNVSQVNIMRNRLLIDAPKDVDQKYLAEHEELDSGHAAEMGCVADGLIHNSWDLEETVAGALTAVGADIIFWQGLSESIDKGGRSGK